MSSSFFDLNYRVRDFGGLGLFFVLQIRVTSRVKFFIKKFHTFFFFFFSVNILFNKKKNLKSN